jgi:hypothetical protein
LNSTSEPFQFDGFTTVPFAPRRSTKLMHDVSTRSVDGQVTGIELATTGVAVFPMRFSSGIRNALVEQPATHARPVKYTKISRQLFRIICAAVGPGRGVDWVRLLVGLPV